MDRSTLIKDHPQLFHMAEAGAWDNIRERGLLSTRALVDLYQPDKLTREAILNQRRTEPHALTTPGLPPAVVRDQKPLQKLKVKPGTTEQQFLDALNGRVFFWLEWKRLFDLVSAKAYRASPHIVLTVSTQSLLEANADRVHLCRLNSGAVTQANHPERDAEIFESIEHFQTRRQLKEGGPRRPTRPVEFTVLGAVPNIAEHVISVHNWIPGHLQEPPLFPDAH